MPPGTLNIHGSVGKVEQADVIHNYGRQIFSVRLSDQALLVLVRDIITGVERLPINRIDDVDRELIKVLASEAETAIAKGDRSGASDKVGRLIGVLKSSFEAVEVIGRVFMLFAGLGPTQ